MALPVKAPSRSARPGAEVMIYGDVDQVRRMTFALAEALTPARLTVFMAQVMRPFLQQEAEARFASEGDEASGKWLPLTERTAEIRESLGLGGQHPINVRTGQLQNFITSTGDVYPTAMQAVLAMPSWQGVGGDPKLTEKVQQAQLGNPDKGSPPRPVLALGNKDLTYALTSLAAFVEAEVAMRTGAVTSGWSTA